MGVFTLDKNEIAALLESLCDRPFADDPDGRSPAMQDMARRSAPGLSPADGGTIPGAEDGATAALASILSASATAAECQGFQEAAMTSSAVRLDAQSALAFVDGIEQAPLGAPAHLLNEVLASAGIGSRSPDASGRRPGIWSRISGIRINTPRARMAAACAVLIMAGGVSWSLLLPPAAPPEGRLAVPAPTNPNDTPLIIPEPAQPAPAPAPISAPTPAPGPAAMSAPMPNPPSAPTAAPTPAPAQALADPCEPRSFARSEAGPESRAVGAAAKRAPSRPPRKTAAAPVTDPGCPDAASRLVTSPAAVPAGATGDIGATEAGRNPKADQAPVRAARPASQVGGLDRHPPAAALSVPRSAPASPAKPPRPNQPTR
jgi:hypothetical protein